MKADAELKTDVESELSWDPAIVSRAIAVSARDGIVTLDGLVGSLAEKLAVERAAQRVSGVRALAVELIVEPAAADRRADLDIAAAARQALDWSVFVPREQVQATVERGHVTLHGEVASGHQRAAAERAVRGLRGVVSLSNLVRITTPVDVHSVERKIVDALARQGAEQASQLTVRAEGTTVRLAGRVRSWAERDAAAQAARAAPGVADVVNDVVVSG